MKPRQPKASAATQTLKGTPRAAPLAQPQNLLAEAGQIINIGGVKVNFLDVGRGPAVFLLHGLATSLVTWQRNIGPLAAAGYRVLALDLPGHGDSEKPRQLSYDPVAGARLLHEFFRLMGIRRVSLAGNSAGGLIVGLYAAEQAKRVNHLALVNSGGLGREVDWGLRLLSVPLLGELVYQPQLQSAESFTRRVFHQPPPFLLETLPEMRRVRLLPGAKRAALQAIRSSVNLFGQRQERNLLKRLQRFPAPLLVVWGDKDRIIPVRQAEAVRRALPGSVVRILRDCGHWPQMECAEEFNKLLTQFFREPLPSLRAETT